MTDIPNFDPADGDRPDWRDPPCRRSRRMPAVRALVGGLSIRMCLAFAMASAVVADARPDTEPAGGEDVEIALDLAQFLRSARTVISANQDLINDPDIADKGLNGEAVLEAAIERYRDATGVDPRSIDVASREGRLFSAQMDAIVAVMEENQSTINQEGLGFKGFVPAVFARLVNEKFRNSVGQEADVKVTAPVMLVRNRKALPDDWESEIIQSKLMDPDWPKDQIFTSETQRQGRSAFRVLIPEYYSEGCLQCHGGPKGEIDITGYPKEGGKLNDLGGVISITLFRQTD